MVAAPGRSRQLGGRVIAHTLLIALIPWPTLAHERSTSYSSWDIHGRHARVKVRLTELEVSRFPWTAEARAVALPAYLAGRLELVAAGSACAVTVGPQSLAAAPGSLVYEWQVACPEEGELSVRSALLLEVAPSHLHFARLTRDGARPLERVLSERESTWHLDALGAAQPGPPSGTPLAGYVVLGIEHILSGYDHLAFLLALLLIGGTLGEVAKLVTGFTVAHSVTLALMVLGYVRPEPGQVEALIGLSIALVAVENIWLVGARGRGLPRLTAGTLVVLSAAAAAGYGRLPALTMAGLALFWFCYFKLLGRVSRVVSLRWGIAFIFGLVHGFGFAAILGEANLPAERVLPALLGFNLGVEFGQLAVVAVVWPLLRLATGGDHGLVRTGLVEFGSAAVLALGVFWFVSRVYF